LEENIWGYVVFTNIGKKVTRKSHRKKGMDKKSQEIKSQEKNFTGKKVIM
jgi:hypothetical protein